MTLSVDRIRKARESNISDDVIVDTIAKKYPDYAEKIQRAKDAKISSKTIVDTLDRKLSTNTPVQQQNAPVRSENTPVNTPVNETNEIKLPPKTESPISKEQHGLLESFQQGLRSSAQGQLEGNAPELEKQAQDPTFWENVVHDTGNIAGDLPYMFAGAAIGSSIGSIGGPIGTVLGGGFGATAVPAFIKEALTQYRDYARQGNDLSFGEFLQRADKVANKTLNEGLFGVVLGSINKAMPLLKNIPGVGKLFESKVTQTGAKIVGETAAAAAVPAIGEGRLPEGKDFARALAIVAGFNIAHLPQAIREDIQSKGVASGKTPEQYAKSLSSSEIQTVKDIAKEKIKPLETAKEPIKEQIKKKLKHNQIDTTATNALLKPKIEAEKSQTETREYIDSVTGKNRSKVLNQAFDEGKITNKKQAEDFVEKYDEVYKTVPGKNASKRNKRFLDLYSQKEQVSGERRPELELTDRQKYDLAVNELRKAKFEGDKVKLKEARKRFDLAKEKLQKSTPKEEVKTEAKVEVKQEPITFETSKGSVYQVNENGTTTRDKKYRPEHGPKEQGIQPVSEKTLYVDKDQLNKLSVFATQGDGGKKMFPYPDGRLGVMYTSGPNKGKVLADSLITPKTKPEKGLYPLELWDKGEKVHFGNEITKIGKYQIKPSPLSVELKIESPKEKIPEKIKDIRSPREILSESIVKPEDTNQKRVPKIKEVVEVANTKLHREYAPLDKLSDGDTTILSNPSKLAETFKGWQGRAKAVLEIADYDLATNEVNGPSFKAIFDKANLKEKTGKSKLDKHGFDIYLAAKTSIERQKMGQTNPMPLDVAERYVAENPQYESIAKDVYKFGQNRIANLRKGDIISPASEKAMNEMYKSHAPLYRLIPQEQTLYEQLTNGSPQAIEPSVPGNSSLRVKQPIKTAKGSNLKIYPPTDSIVRNTLMFEQSIAKNRVLKASANGIEKNLGYVAKTAGKSKLSKAKLQELMGPEFEVTDEMVPELNEAYDIANIGGDIKRGTFRYYDKGQLMEIEAPKEIIEAIDGLSPQQSNIVIEMAAKWKNVFSQGVVLQPGTLIRLAGMDVVVSGLQSKYPTMGIANLPINAFYNIPKMMFNILKKGELFQDYLRSGAAQTSMRGLDRAMMESMTTELTNADTWTNQTTKGLAKETVKAPFKLVKQGLKGLAKTSEFLSDATRMVEFEKSYKANLKKGMSKEVALSEAAFDAFEVSVPYGRRGSSNSLRGFYKIFPWMNTIMNSNMSFAKAINPKTNKNIIPFMAQTVSAITMPTIALYLKNRNDPRYQALPQEDRDRNVYMWNTDDPNEAPTKLRKFWQYGFAFQTLPERTIEFILQKDPSAYEGLLKSFEYEFSPLTFLSLYEGFKDGFDPSKLIEGRFSFIPEKQKRVEASLQHTASTSETAKKLGRYSKISPIYIDYIIGMTGGGLGKDAVKLIDEALYATGASEDRRPQKELADNIFWGTFFGRPASTRSQYLNEFYEYSDKFNLIKGTAKELREQGRDEEAEKIMADYINTDTMRKDFSKYYKRIDKIRGSDPYAMDKKTKRDELNEVYREMTAKAKEYVEKIKSEIKSKRQ